MSKRVLDHIRDRLEQPVRAWEGYGTAPRDLSARPHAEAHKDFTTLMRNRLDMGSIRYGPWLEANVRAYDNMGEIARRLERYLTTGNTEYLVDAANFCLIEFHFPSAVGAHFRPVDNAPDAHRAQKK